MNTKRAFRAVLALLLLALPAGAAAQSSSTLRALARAGTSLPPTTDGDRYVLLGNRDDVSLVVHDTVTGRTRTLPKPAGCGWSEAPRAAFAGAVVMQCPTGVSPLSFVLLNLRTGAVRRLPSALSYTGVGRSWLAGFDGQGDLFVHRRRDEMRRSTGLRDLDHARLRPVCRRLRQAGAGRPESASLAYDRDRYVVTSDAGLQLRPCARRRKAVRLERGRFAGFELPDALALSSGFVTWTSLRDGATTLGYDVRTRRRWAWPTGPEDVALHTRNALLVRRVATVFELCGSVGCPTATWTAQLATISRKASKPKPKKRKRRS
ncbi:MAG TPA: hypothetical protein VF549_19995 [Solirubrobacteraceae bacterium]|jgi:hypothetical protein